VKGEIGPADLRKLRHLVYLSEAWNASAAEKPAKADEIDAILDDASKPN
jgi:hypothetical protein